MGTRNFLIAVNVFPNRTSSAVSDKLAMKILLVHPEDSSTGGPWSASRWDVIVDLGFASAFTYEQWSRRLGARVFSIYQFAGQGESYRWVNQVLDHGRGMHLVVAAFNRAQRGTARAAGGDGGVEGTEVRAQDLGAAQHRVEILADDLVV